ncbi:MAG: hypothetical protein AAFV95_08060 [Bacteroidota bacterium]
MDYDLIKALLEKYWAGESSLEEERQLKQYFSQADIAPELKPFQSVFQLFAQEASPSLDEDFDRRLEQRLHQQAKTVRLSTADKRPARFLYRRIASAAAILLLAVATVWWVWPETAQKPAVASNVDWEKYECPNPEDCLEQVQMALKLVSGKLNKGTDVAASGLEKMEVATSILK